MENIEELLSNGHIRHIRLTQDYDFKPFDCGVNDLNDFLFNDSKIYLQHLGYTTFILESDNKIIAYYSLANDVLRITDIEDFRCEIDGCCMNLGYEERFYDQRMFPAAKIGRLAVDIDFQSKGIGEFIIDFLKFSFINENKTGCQFITVDAINSHRVLKFYDRLGFHYLTAHDVGKESRQMFMCLLEYVDLGIDVVE